jgi:hypothetical protein
MLLGMLLFRRLSHAWPTDLLLAPVQAEKYDVQVSKEALVAFYNDVAPDKAADTEKIDQVLEKVKR